MTSHLSENNLCLCVCVHWVCLKMMLIIYQIIFTIHSFIVEGPIQASMCKPYSAIRSNAAFLLRSFCRTVSQVHLGISLVILPAIFIHILLFTQLFITFLSMCSYHFCLPLCIISLILSMLFLSVSFIWYCIEQFEHWIKCLLFGCVRDMDLD